jgi:hypothetical protein
MAIVLVNTTVANTGSGQASTLSINMPTGTAVGQFLLFNGGCNSATITASIPGFTTVPGFTFQANGTTINQNIQFRIIDGTEGASFTIGVSPSSARTSANLACYSGVDPNSPFAGVGQSTTVATTTAAFPAANTLFDQAYAVLCLTSRNATGAQTLTAPTGFITSADTASTSTAWIEAAIADSHTAYAFPQSSINPGSGTISQSSGQCRTTILLRPATGSSFFAFM